MPETPVTPSAQPATETSRVTWGESPSGVAGVSSYGPQRRPSPCPLGSLLASAQRLTSQTLNRRITVQRDWQRDAWEAFDLVGEQRYLAVTLAGRLSQAQLYVGRLTDNARDTPESVTNPAITAILDSLGTPVIRSQLIARLGVNLFIAGDGWLVGIPRHLLPASLSTEGGLRAPSEIDTDEIEQPALSIDDLHWRMLSISEISSNAGGEVQIRLGEDERDVVKVSPDEVILIRVWRPHPQKWWEADSPTRSCLPVLRELIGLTMDISAQVDSRLAGAGVFLIPQSAQRALQVAAGQPEDAAEDVFTKALMQAMLTPISDRSNASALVPLCVTVPDDSTERFRHITFGRSLEETGLRLREEAIRRLALGEDAPPELLLGSGGLNHWGAWLVLEDVVSTHLEPPLALICDALTTQFLWPVLRDQGYSDDEAHQYVIWYDVSDLVVRPNHTNEAQVLHEKGVISDTALRTAVGFDEADAPPPLAPEIALALDMCKAAPSLVTSPGLGVLVEQLRSLLAGQVPPGAPGAAPDTQPLRVPESSPVVPTPAAMPDTAGNPARPSPLVPSSSSPSASPSSPSSSSSSASASATVVAASPAVTTESDPTEIIIWPEGCTQELPATASRQGWPYV